MYCNNQPSTKQTKISKKKDVKKWVVKRLQRKQAESNPDIDTEQVGCPYAT
jgi:hypothetical protein